MRRVAALLFPLFFSLPSAASVSFECSAPMQLGQLGIETVLRVGPLRMNGGENIDYRAFVSLGDDYQRFAARSELYVARLASQNGEQFIAVTDGGVGRCLDSPSYVPDLLSVVTLEGQTAFRFREVKSGNLTPVRIAHALDQLTSGVEDLLRRIPDATVDLLELVYVVRPGSGDRYGLLSNSPRATIRVATRTFQVTSRIVTPPADDEYLLSLTP